MAEEGSGTTPMMLPDLLNAARPPECFILHAFAAMSTIKAVAACLVALLALQLGASWGGAAAARQLEEPSQ